MLTGPRDRQVPGPAFAVAGTRSRPVAVFRPVELGYRSRSKRVVRLQRAKRHNSGRNRYGLSPDPVSVYRSVHRPRRPRPRIFHSNHAAHDVTQSLDDFVCAHEHRLRNRDAKRLGGLQVNDEFKPRHLFNRQIARWRALEDLVDLRSGSFARIR